MTTTVNLRVCKRIWQEQEHEDEDEERLLLLEDPEVGYVCAGKYRFEGDNTKNDSCLVASPNDRASVVSISLGEEEDACYYSPPIWDQQTTAPDDDYARFDKKTTTEDAPSLMASIVSDDDEEESSEWSSFSILEDIACLRDHDDDSKRLDHDISDDNNKRDHRSWLREVTFHDTVQVREHAVTVAGYPASGGDSEHLMLTMDWPYNVYCYGIEESQYREGYYRGPAKLTYQERRERLRKAAGFTDEELDEIEKQEERAATSEELRILVSVLTKPWTQLFQCHALEYYDDDDYDEDDYDDDRTRPRTKPQKELQRSRSFYLL